MKRIVILGGGTGGHLAAGEVDGTRNRLVSYDGREVAFDRAVVVPLHGGASYVDRRRGSATSSGPARPVERDATRGQPVPAPDRRTAAPR